MLRSDLAVLHRLSSPWPSHTSYTIPAQRMYMFYVYLLHILTLLEDAYPALLCS